jgi:WD40 repeat protein
MEAMFARRAFLFLLALTSAARGDDALPDGAIRRMVVTEDGEGTLFCVAFSPEGKTLAVGGSLKRVHLFDVKTGELLRSFGNHPDNVWTVAWSSDGKLLCSGGRADLTLRVWDPKKGDDLKPFEGHKGGITRIKFFRDGKRLIMSGGSWDPTIRVWDVARREQVLALTGHTDLIDAMDLAPNGRLAISGSRDGTLRLWDLAGGREVWRYEREQNNELNGGFTAVAFAPDGRTFASATGDGTLQVRETVTRRRWLPAPEHNGTVSAIAFSPDGRLLAFSRREQVVMRDARNGEEVRVCRGHRALVRGLAFAPDGRALASCGDDAAIYLWTVPSPADLSKKLGDAERGREVDLLGSDNAVIARHAVTMLASDLGPVAAALAPRIKPAPAVNATDFERRIEQLDSRNYAERERAQQDLERAAEQAELSLRSAYARATDVEQRRRLDRLLEKLDRRVPSSDELWQLRAVAVLEQRGDAESRALLRKLAAGASSRLTTEAIEALERMK